MRELEPENELLKGPGLTLETGAKKSIAGEWLLGVGEAVGVMALPIPAVTAHIRDVVLGLPTHHALGLGGIAPVGGDIAGTALADHVGQLLAARLGEGGDDLEYRGAGAGAQVKDLDAGLAVHPVKGGNVTRGQIAHVNVVAHAGAVGGGVVVAKDLNGLELAHGNLGDIGHQVVGDALGVLADQARRMSADGVEVTEQHDVPLGVGGMDVHKDLLDHPLGPTIGVGRGLLRILLGDGRVVRVAVDGRGAREDDGLAAMVAHDVDEHQGVLDVVVVVLDGLAHRLADGLKAGKVDDAVDLMGIEDLVHRIAVEHVGLVEGEVLGGLVAHDGLDAVDGDGAGVGEIIDDDDLVATLEQLNDGVRADKAGATGNEDAGVFGVECFGHVVSYRIRNTSRGEYSAGRDAQIVRCRKSRGLC